MKKLLAVMALTLTLSVGLSLAPTRVWAQGCSLCVSQVETARTEKDARSFAGLNTGILYLMTIPYVLMGAVGFFWYRQSQQKKQTR